MIKQSFRLIQTCFKKNIFSFSTKFYFKIEHEEKDTNQREYTRTIFFFFLEMLRIF
jgi:hypothetical protein